MDPKVANTIFKECVQTALKDKIVVLCTHQLQFILGCKKIIVLENGTQRMQGSYEEIQEKGMDIESILSDYNKAL